MRECEGAGKVVKKKKVEKALIAGPLHRRTRLDRRFANIAAIMRIKGLSQLKGFKPQENVGSNVAPLIDKAINNYMRGLESSNQRHHCRLDCLVKEIPNEAFVEAAKRLVIGESFEFHDSREYDVETEDSLIPPKKLTSLASQIWYGAPLGSHNFVGAESSAAFRRIEAAGFNIKPKLKSLYTDPESIFFREEVDRWKQTLKEPPKGNIEPQRLFKSVEQFERDTKVVAFAEKRANGICELCRQPAPFVTFTGRPFLEIHHIVPLGDGGKDVVENVAALCPNCHRMCHFGEEIEQYASDLAKMRRTTQDS